MAEFCEECWNKINGIEDGEIAYRLSREPELCEECGEYKRVIIEVYGRGNILSYLFTKIKKLLR